MIALLLAQTAAAQGLAGFLSPGPLAEPHAGIDTVTGCPQCHALGSGVSPAKCQACHDGVAEQVRSGQGFHADKGDRCQACHPDHRGRGFALVKLAEHDFDHAATGFALQGKHLRAECTDCHTAGTWTGLAPTCRSCHDEPHGAADSKRRTLLECGSCHGVEDWKVRQVPASVLDHGDAQQVDYVLEGAHREVGCDECHPKARFLPTAHDGCATCHKDPHFGLLGGGCAGCHTVQSFRVAAFDHARTGWPLEGQHAEATCESCHRGAHGRRLPHAACSDCHADEHHGQFDPRPCDACHTVNVEAFRLPGFDHDGATAFPLHGEHERVPCAKCHGEGPAATYVGVRHEDCDACHDDPHAGKFEPSDCSTCHTEQGWAGVGEGFDHSRTDFPLRGAHLGPKCEACHVDQKWAGIAHESCLDCHADDQPHGDTFPPDRCATCHAEDAWASVTFDHGSTGFALAPQHGSVACERCHDGGKRFVGLSGACDACHADTRPVGHYRGACGDCHAAADWVPTTFAAPLDHAITGFPLQGVHALEPCASCHPADAPKGDAVGACVACHADDDWHRHALGDACGDCHRPTSWVQTRFRHFQTGWSLRGAHRMVACDTCHALGYVATPSDCRACHGGEADPTVPAHRSVFAADCERCHAPFTWAAIGYGHPR